MEGRMAPLGYFSNFQIRMLAHKEWHVLRHQTSGIPLNTHYLSLAGSLRWVTSHVSYVLYCSTNENITSAYLRHFQLNFQVRIELIDDQSEIAVCAQFEAETC